jgi:post-segregation antitoxin (ccd killing protein)
LEVFLKVAGNGDANLLYNLYYEEQSGSRLRTKSFNLNSSLDLAFNDEILEDVEEEWKVVTENDSDRGEFMQFEERAGMNEEDDSNDDDF